MTQNESVPSNEQLLAGLVKRLQGDLEYMASLLFEYQRLERMDDLALASKLESSPSQLIRLALCKRPDSGSADFAQQVEQLAMYTGVPTTNIITLIRQVESLKAFRNLPSVTSAETDSVDLETQASIYGTFAAFAAARDREQMQEEPPDYNETKGVDEVQLEEEE